MGIIQVVLIVVVVMLITGLVLAGGNWLAHKFGMNANLLNAMNLAVVVLVCITLFMFVLNAAGCDWRAWDIPIHQQQYKP